MKELSIEEKAKAYDELFVKAKTMMIENTNEVDGAKILTKLFPQLAESEDEKVRKELLAVINDLVLPDEQQSRFVAWLEKQGADISLFSNEQQKYMEKYLSLDKITLIKLLAERDVNNAEIIESFEKQGEQTPKHFELKERHWYICHRAFCCRADHLTVKEGERFMCEKDGVVKGFVIKEPEKYFKEVCAPAPMEDEQKPADKVEPKFKVGDEIRTKNEESLTITRIDRWGYWSEDLFICSFDDAAKWELVEQKPAWSEEDETKINYLIALLQNSTMNDNALRVMNEDVENWLKSRPQRQWKPSDEQISALHNAIDYLYDTKHFNAQILYFLEEIEKQLKAL